MFTGIIEAVGTLAGLTPTAAGYQIRIRTALAPELKTGDSLAVNGVCLTVTLIEDTTVGADIGPETAQVTSLGGLSPNAAVNLERSLPVNGRLGGHLVQGHVDGVGIVDGVRAEAEAHWLTISHPPSLGRYFIRKGSVAVDGVSLTVAELGDAYFDVQIVPYTWTATNLRALRTGDKVNLECDMIGKYVIRAMEIR